MVMTLASNLTVGNVADMKFLCKDHVQPPHLLDSIRYPRDLIGLLEKQHLLSQNSLYFMQTLLYYISRLDLYELVLDFRADKQQEYKDRGVDIKAVYDLRNDAADRATLVQKVLKFRQDLKPKSRFQRADISGLRKQLNELSTKMQNEVTSLQETNYVKHKLSPRDDEGCGDGGGKNLPAISSSVEDNDDVTTTDGKNNTGEVVVKLKLYDRKDEKLKATLLGIDRTEEGTVQPRSKPRTGKRSRVSSISSSVRSSVMSPFASSVVSATESVSIVIPNAYEEDEKEEMILKIPHVIIDPVPETGERFEYTTPIPPPRSDTLNAATGKLLKTARSRLDSLDNFPDDEDSESRSLSPTGESGHPTTNLDTEHLSEAIKRLRKRMGIDPKTKSKRRAAGGANRRISKKERKLVKNINASRKGKLKGVAKVKTEKDDTKLPNIYDKFARHASPSSGGVHYVNIFK